MNTPISALLTVYFRFFTGFYANIYGKRNAGFLIRFEGFFRFFRFGFYREIKLKRNRAKKGKKWEVQYRVPGYPNPFTERFDTEAEAKLIDEAGLPKVVFHSLRHLSTSMKLQYSGGDIKAVQGDTGHAQASMVTQVYSHTFDENRSSRT